MKPVASPYLVPFDNSFKIADFPTAPPADGNAKEWDKELEDSNEELADLQRMLYADDRFSLLLVFQAMDAAGKDSTIRAVMTGVNPAGFQVYSFKQPSDEELDHDFMWRSSKRLPERGRIGIFNRSYYEEVLVVRTHPNYLKSQKLPYEPALDELWEQRYHSIRENERHLARNGTVVIKFWLNVSRRAQLDRFIARIDEPSKNWKFSAGDVKESRLWDQYMEGYEAALNGTSREFAPWFAIPADDKDYMRMCVADIVVRTLKQLSLRYPEPSEDDLQEMAELRTELVAEREQLGGALAEPKAKSGKGKDKKAKSGKGKDKKAHDKQAHDKHDKKAHDKKKKS